MDFSAQGILARMRSNLKNEDTKLEGSFSMDNLQAVSEELARINAMLVVPLATTLEERESDIGTSGNERHYVQWAKEAKNSKGERVAGNAKVDCPRDGTGNVYIAIVSANALKATEEEVKIVQDYINTKRPVGANPIVSAAEGIRIQISCNIKIKAGYTLETIKAQMRNDIQQYFIEIAFQSGIISLNYFNICNLISAVAGIKELEDMTINGKKESITADYNKYFSFEELIINVTE